MRHLGFTREDSAGPRFAVAVPLSDPHDPAPSRAPTARAEAASRGGPSHTKSFPGDAWATCPISADYDPLWDDYDY